MNKRAYIFCLIVFMMGFMIAYFCGFELGSYEYSSPQDKAVDVSPKEETQVSTEGYWVKAHNDKIFVYKSDGRTVIAETDIDISQFSSREKKILESGIYLETAEELFKYLEANTS